MKEEQNKLIQKVITAYKERNVQKKELIFLLKQGKMVDLN